MVRRSLKWLFARHVAFDSARLLRNFGSDALFTARRAVRAAREDVSGSHWHRVLTEVEMMVGYRPW